MQKTKKFRRLLAGGVAVLMLGVSVPVAAFATGDGTNQNPVLTISFVNELGEPLADSLTFASKDESDVVPTYDVGEGQEVVWQEKDGNGSVPQQLYPGSEVYAVDYASYIDECGEYGAYVQYVPVVSAKSWQLVVKYMDGDTEVWREDMTVEEGQTISASDFNVPEGYALEDPNFSTQVYSDITGTEINVPVYSTATVPSTVKMNIQFKDGDEFIAGGDYDVPAGVQNYSVLEQYVPEGYKMTVSGDFTAEEGGKLVVNIEKISTDVTVNVNFEYYDVTDGFDTFVPDYEDVLSGTVTVKENVTVAELISEAGLPVPDGYELSNGDYTYDSIEEGMTIRAEFVKAEEPAPETVTMNIQFKDGDEVVAGGDYFVPAGVQNYAVLEQYVPEGYKMTISGDFYAEEGGKLTVNVEKIVNTVIMGIRFVTRDGEFVAGGDYFLPEGVQNYSILEQYLSEGYKLAETGDFMVEEGGQLDVVVEKISTDVIMKIRFVTRDGEFVAGGDYFLPEGVQNLSILEDIVPEGYQMTETGDFMVEEGGSRDVTVEKVGETTDVIMNIRFVTRDGEFVAGGDYFLPEGVQNYSILEDLVPEGYQMTVSGDFMVEAGTSLDVTIEKISTDVIMNIRFVTRDGTFVAGGDYFLPEGVQNLSILEDLVPTGYRMTETGDFMVEAGTSRDVTIELIPTEVIMNIQFWDNDSGEVVAGGDYFVPVDEDGIQNYSVLQQYVPEGYEMLTGGDFFVVEGGHLDVTVQKIQRDVIMNIRFVLADGTFIAGGDYFLPEGIQNMSILEQYVPAGYKMMESGDFFVTEGGQEDITVEKINETVTVSVAFKNEWGFVVGGGYYIVPAGEQDVSVLAQYVPAGYVLDEEGTINFVDGQHYDISVKSDESIVNIQFIDREGNVIAGGDYFVPTGVQNTAILDELGYTPVGYRQVVHTYVLFMYGHHYVILVEAIPEQVTAKTAVFRKDAAEDVWNENPDNPDEVRYTFYSDDAEATNTVPSITVADETKELDYWVAEMDSSITLQPGEEFCYNDLDQGALKDQIGDLLFIAVYKDVEVVEPTPAPSEEPTPAPSEEPTPAPSEEPTPAPSEEPTPAPSEQPTAEPTAAPTAQPETPADNNDDNTTTVTSDNSDDVVKSDTPADNTAKVLPQTGVESSAPVIGFAFVLLAALGGAAAYLFVVRKKLN